MAQKLPYGGEFLLTAGITDTAHLAGLHAQFRPLPLSGVLISYADTITVFLFCGGRERAFDGRSIVPLPISVTRCGRSDKAWMGEMFAEGKRRGGVTRGRAIMDHARVGKRSRDREYSLLYIKPNYMRFGAYTV